MATGKHARPSTRRTSSPRPGELVWDDAFGWGIVVETEEALHRHWTEVCMDPTIEKARDINRELMITVAWPDAARVENQSSPVQVVSEPVKLLGAIERSIDAADDPLATAVELGHSAFLRADGPRVFRVAWALKSWGCERLVHHELSKFPEWIRTVLTPLAEGWDGAHARLRRRSNILVGLLRSDTNVLARLAGAAAAFDFDDALVRRRDEDAEEVLATLTVALEQAATKRGVDGARRRFRARLLTLERKYGHDAKRFWAEQRDKARGRFESKMDELRGPTRS